MILFLELFSDHPHRGTGSIPPSVSRGHFPGIQPATGDGIDDAKIPSAPASFRFGAVEGLLEPARAHHLPRSPTTSRAEQRKGEENGWSRRREEARRSSTESRAAGDDVRRLDVLQLRAPLCLLQDPAMAARRRMGAWIRPLAATPTRPPWSPGAGERCRAGSEVAGREEGLAARRHGRKEGRRRRIELPPGAADAGPRGRPHEVDGAGHPAPLRAGRGRGGGPLWRAQIRRRR
jgi:hypothetical protein